MDKVMFDFIILVFIIVAIVEIVDIIAISTNEYLGKYNRK